MNLIFGLCYVFILVHLKAVAAKPGVGGARRCVNMWDEGCINGQLPGAGGDDSYLNGDFNPGKRCINVWDDGCNNGPMAVEEIAYKDQDYEDIQESARRFLYTLMDRFRKKHQLY